MLPSVENSSTTALLTVEGELDDISGSGQTAAAHDLCTGIPKAKRQHYEVEGAGHYGIFSGRRWRDMVYPVVKSFILSNNGTKTAAAKTSGNTAKPKSATKTTRRRSA
mgnify:FL=1